MTMLLDIDTTPALSPQRWRRMIADALDKEQWQATDVDVNAQAEVQNYLRLVQSIMEQCAEFEGTAEEDSQDSSDDEERKSQSSEEDTAAMAASWPVSL